MIAHPHRTRVLLLWVLLLCFAGTAWGQRISREVRQAQEATANVEADITKFIAPQVARLADANESTQRTAREVLEREAGEREGEKPSTVFQDVYARTLDRELMGLLKKNSPPPPLKVKLNVGVVAAGVARQIPSGGLADVAEALMKDKEAALQLWGIKIAKYVLPFSNRPLGKEIVDTVKANKNPDAAGMLAEEADAALSLEPFRNADDSQFGPWAKLVYPRLLELVDYRTSLYAQGTPPSPLAEEKAVQFLSVKGWDLAARNDPRLQKATLKSIGELSCATMHAMVNSGGTDENVFQMTRATGAALSVIGDSLGRSDVSAAARPISGISANASADKVDGYCKNLSAALAAAGVKINENIGSDQTATDTTPTPTDGTPADNTGNKSGK